MNDLVIPIFSSTIISSTIVSHDTNNIRISITQPVDSMISIE